MHIEYLQSIKKSTIESLAARVNARSLFHSTSFYEGKIIENTTFDLFILGVKDDRFRPEYKGCKDAPDAVREELYSLIKPRKDLSILDLGNIEAGAAISDTRFALTQVLAPLLKQKSIVILIGGSQDLIASQYAAFQGISSNLQVVVVDAKAEMQMYEDSTANNYLPNIIAHEPDYLFNLTQAAYQGYYVEPETYDAFERMNFDMLRLGSLRGNIQEIEPYLRDAQMLAFSIKAIRGSDAMGQIKPSPNGLTGELGYNSIEDALSNMSDYSCKFVRLYEKIEKSIGPIFIYSNFLNTNLLKMHFGTSENTKIARYRANCCNTLRARWLK
jgi:arginase family enzyme